ncbi:BLUF domain-containing protein [Methylobacterium sp. J-070]|uniref:BLUF domain-containing protein n=1 Tax=Methylobacterium sp. J-070 TaxID=2836650 RepID=UPI001FBB0E76|nr:BLUF domain-containing protein [Methylobacterium sp. J-070]MCJ2054041.1 BLUF domain-containing protein [Methylobacterium sp. J-070]
MSALYRLVYASKNLLTGPEAEAAVEQILAASRRNNERVGVTGALMFNGGAFAQVLEGPQKSVEQTFERIQRDPRHGDVTVLEGTPITERGFVNWSMAFVGQSARGQVLWNELAAESGFDLARLSADAVFMMLHDLVLEEEPLGNIMDTPPPDAVARQFPDMPQVREEIAHLRSEAVLTTERQNASRDHESVATLAILKAALAHERGRTTELRGTVDELHIAMAEIHAACDRLRAERDLWMQRARVLVAALCDDPQEIRSATRSAEVLAGQSMVAVPARACA